MESQEGWSALEAAGTFCTDSKTQLWEGKKWECVCGDYLDSFRSKKDVKLLSEMYVTEDLTDWAKHDASVHDDVLLVTLLRLSPYFSLNKEPSLPDSVLDVFSHPSASSCSAFIYKSLWNLIFTLTAFIKKESDWNAVFDLLRCTVESILGASLGRLPALSHCDFHEARLAWRRAHQLLPGPVQGGGVAGLEGREVAQCAEWVSFVFAF